MRIERDSLPPNMLFQEIAEERIQNEHLNRRELNNRKEYLSSWPISVQIEPTNLCNLNCIICAREEWKDPPGHMNRDVFENLKSALQRSMEVVIGGYGEPFLGKNFWDILQYCKISHAWTRIITNGSLLDKAACEKLIDLQVDRLVVSIDGSSDSLLRYIRGIALSDIVSNLKDLNNLKLTINSRIPEVWINFTAMAKNIEDLPELVKIAKGIDAAGITVSHIKIYNESMFDQSLFHQRELTEKIFREAESIARKLGLWLQLPSLNQLNKFCPQPFEVIFIRWNGDAIGCCSAIFSPGKFNLYLGNVLDSNLHSLWNSYPIRKYRRAVKGEDKLPPVCEECAFRHDTFESHLRTAPRQVER